MYNGVKPNHALFVLHSLFHWQPVKLLKRRCDMLTWFQIADEASSGILDSLKDVDSGCW